MPKLNKNVFLALAGIVIIAAIYGANRSLSLWSSAQCENRVVDSVESPSASKKIVVFVTDCGVTAEYGVHVSILNSEENIDNQSMGNILSINSNHGYAWPSSLGWPMVKSVWKIANSATIYYAMNSEVFSQHADLNGVSIEFVPITPEIIERERIEIK
jgi:hypothetical protein